MSKNYERYFDWYNERKSITDEQLDELVKVGLLTNEEKESIIEGNKIEE